VLELLSKQYAASGLDPDVVEFYRKKTEFEQHVRLCRGESQTDNRLVCRYVHYHQPHLRIQPFKLEELQLDPPVVRFYDLISDKEAEKIISAARNKVRGGIYLNEQKH
jgi:hypothetical protein